MARHLPQHCSSLNSESILDRKRVQFSGLLHSTIAPIPDFITGDYFPSFCSSDFWPSDFYRLILWVSHQKFHTYWCICIFVSFKLSLSLYFGIFGFALGFLHHFCWDLYWVPGSGLSAIVLILSFSVVWVTYDPFPLVEWVRAFVIFGIGFWPTSGPSVAEIGSRREKDPRVLLGQSSILTESSTNSVPKSSSRLPG